MDAANDEHARTEMTNSLESLGTSQSLVSFSEPAEDKLPLMAEPAPRPPSVVAPLPRLQKEQADREGYCAGNEDSDEEQQQQRRDGPGRLGAAAGGIDIPSPSSCPNSLSTASLGIKRLSHEAAAAQNCRKTLRLSSEQIVSPSVSYLFYRTGFLLYFYVELEKQRWTLGV